jgi:hypothetical protein
MQMAGWVVVATVGGVSSRRYAVVVGTVLLVAAVFFAVMPALLDYDAFIPVILTLVCTVAAIAVFVQGMAGE